MIRRGLRIDDQDYQEKIERVTLDPNRKRDAFQRDMDNFLFGGPPVRKNIPKKQEPQKKVQVTPPQKQQTPSTKKQQVQVSRKIQSNTSYRQTTQIQTVIIQKSYELSGSQVTQSRTQMDRIKQTQNTSLKDSKISKTSQSKLVVQKPQSQIKVMGERQMSEVFRQIQSSRPNYIRKLKQVADVNTFSQQNINNHKFIDVVRPIQCSRNYLSKLNCPNFKDKQFPPAKISLGVQLQQYNVQWKRHEQFVKHSTLGKYIDPNDIKKGKFSSNKFISTLSVLAEKQQNIKRLIQDQTLSSNKGLYFVRLFVNSVWRYYAIDSYLPFSEGIHASAISYNDSDSDLWVSLVEKAYAKAFNGYDVFTRPQPRQYYLRDLTGAPTSNYRVDNPQILNIVKKALQNKKVVAAVLKSHASNLGVNSNCSLAVLGTNKKSGLTIRYSWPLIKERSQIPISREGVFDLSDSQLAEYVSYITIANVNRNYFTTTIQTRHQKQFYVAYKINIKQSTHGYFTISQFDQRLFPRQGYVYEPARLFIHRKVNDNKYEYVNGGFSHMSRNLDVEVDLSPGQYHIFAYINWNHNVYDFNITFYGSKSIDFIKIPTTKNHNLISLGLQSYNIEYGRRSALGHVHQFITHHQQTNQILITIVNTSNKNYSYANDLKKINFSSLHLMNLKNNQHNVLENLTKEELQNYKLQALQNRKWQLDLAPQQAFTWIISTSQNYDPNSFRNWGFR